MHTTRIQPWVWVEKQLKTVVKRRNDFVNRNAGTVAAETLFNSNLQHYAVSLLMYLATVAQSP